MRTKTKRNKKKRENKKGKEKKKKKLKKKEKKTKKENENVGRSPPENKGGIKQNGTNNIKSSSFFFASPSNGI